MKGQRLKEDVLNAICLMIDAGFNTFGGFTEAQILNKALIFSLVLEEDERVDAEIIMNTSMRYLKGQVTRYEDGGQVPVGFNFPSAPEFYNACLQTYESMYRTISVGETQRNGAIYCHTLRVRRDIKESQLEEMITNERRRLGLTVAEPHKPLSHDQERKASEIIRRVFGDDIKLKRDEEE